MKPLAVCALLCAMMALTSATDESCARKKPPCSPCGCTENYDQCLIYVPKPMTWAEAQKNCESMNGNLASVQSLEEYQLVQKAISEASQASDRTWIGGSDGQQDGYWFWIDGARFTYTNWCSGQPNNNNGIEECMEMNFSGDKCMNDLDCLKRLPSVCVRRN
ncbi:ladderlectin-like [Archocentrus centrarchus]|uniref:ladderlectin-like n=1 Tax=Archocentrus centrarchus TaxID=63155 RepID=UPI0011EA2296|nr:ladderlectin-like [Archocentrus centrarchus]